MKKKKKTLEDKLDDVFSDYIRLRDADYRGYVRCYCCGYPIHWKMAHNSHFMNRWHTGTRYYPPNCHSCCSICNTSLGGNLKAYEEHLKRDFGDTIIEVLTMMKNTITKYTNDELEGMIIHYRNEVNKLKKEKGL